MKKEGKKPLDLDTPLFSIQMLIDLLSLEPDNDQGKLGRAIAILCLTAEITKAFTPDWHPTRIVLPGLVDNLASDLPEKEAEAFTKVLSKAEQNIDSFLHEQQRVFYSLNDAASDMIENKSVPARLVKALLGGKWPEHPFNFECIGEYTMEEDGTLVPFDGVSEPAPGPDFQLQFKMIHDPIHPFGSEGDR